MTSKIKWYFHVIFLSPCLLLLFIGVVDKYLGCSEYDSYKSETCLYWESILDIDLYWTLTIAFISISFVAIPITLIILLIYGIVIIQTITKKFLKKDE